jgi:hypothetical protein
MFNASESHSSPAGVCVSSESAATQCTSAQPDRVIVFAGFPEAGQAKTRSIPALGPEPAARLQAALTRRTLDVTRQICLARQRNLEVRFAGGDQSCMYSMFGAGTRYSAQQGAGLGDRLEHAVAAAFMEGAK